MEQKHVRHMVPNVDTYITKLLLYFIKNFEEKLK